MNDEPWIFSPTVTFPHSKIRKLIIKKYNLQRITPLIKDINNFFGQKILKNYINYVEKKQIY